MTPRQNELMEFLVSKGLHVLGAAAITGNCSQEVGINLPTKFTLLTDHGSQGIAQWRLVRLTALEQFAEDKKLPVTDLTTQAMFLLQELATDYAALDKMMRAPGTRTLANLTANFMTVFERPSFNPAINKLDFRITQAQICARDFIPPEPAVPISHDVAIGGTGAAGAIAIGAAAWNSGAAVALVVTGIAAILIFGVAIYTAHLRRRSAATAAPANAILVKDSTQELKAALDELRLAYDKVAAAKAVLLTNRQQGDELLAILGKLGTDS
jgi:hypothetical protein